MKKQNGITILSLVVTIIILLILAGISLNLIIGDDGVVDKTNESVNATKKAVAEDQVYLAWSSAQTEYFEDKSQGGPVNAKKYFLASKLTSYVSEGEIVDVDYEMNSKGESKVIYKDTSEEKPVYYTVIVKGDGKVLAEDEATTVPPVIIPSDPTQGEIDNKEEIDKANNTSQNAQNMISLVQTAEGSLNEVQSMLNRMVELATQAGNGTNSNEDRTAIAKEIQALIQEINRVSRETEFNGMKLLDGTLAGSNGAKLALAERNLTVSIDAVNSGSLGLGVVDVSTSENSIASVEIIKSAIKSISKVRSELGGRQNQLEHLITYYDSVAENLSAGFSAEDSKNEIAKSGVIEILYMLNRMQYLNNTAINGTLNSYNREDILVEVLYLKEGINVIAEDANYKGEKLLDGTYNNIPNLSCVGLGTNGAELYVGYDTDANIARTKTEFANAILKVEEILNKM